METVLFILFGVAFFSNALFFLNAIIYLILNVRNRKVLNSYLQEHHYFTYVENLFDNNERNADAVKMRLKLTNEAVKNEKGIVSRKTFAFYLRHVNLFMIWFWVDFILMFAVGFISMIMEFLK